LPSLGSSIFYNVPANALIFVPCPSVSAYKLASVWSSRSSYITSLGGISDTGYLSVAICQGASYFFGGRSISVAGEYYDTAQTALGCDSLVILTLGYYEKQDTVMLYDTVCYGVDYSLNGFDLYNQTASGVHFNNDYNLNGCDSVTILNLTVNIISTTQISDSIYSGGTYNFNGRTLTANGTYRDTLQTIHGCDSIVELTLSIREDVGIAQWTIDNGQLKIYPNPTTGKLTINNGQLAIENVEIYNIAGQKVYGYQVQGAGYEVRDNIPNPEPSTPYLIDISHLANGMYFLKIGNRTARFVKE
jgi:hypothetical protein